MLYLGVCRCQPEWPFSQSGPGAVRAISSGVTIPPEVEPLTLPEVKLNHRIEIDDEDTALELMIQAAREYVERYLGRSIITQTREALFAFYDATWPTTLLPYGPVQTVDSVAQDANGRYVVTYVAGYGDAGTDVPASIRQAMQLLIGDWYEHREDIVVGTTTTRITTGLRSLLDFYRGRAGFA